MITLRDELLSLAQAAAACPVVDGKRPHLSSIWRWMKKGCRGVYLEHIRVGSHMCTTRKALEEFFQATAEAPTPGRAYDATTVARTSKQRERDLAQARAELREEHGINVGGGVA